MQGFSLDLETGCPKLAPLAAVYSFPAHVPYPVIALQSEYWIKGVILLQQPRSDSSGNQSKGPEIFWFVLQDV